MDIDKIKHIAEICYLGFEEEKLLEFQDDFNETFELVSKIKTIDTDNVEPTNKVIDIVSNMTNDEVLEGLNLDETFMNAPKREYDYFKVVRFVE